MFNKGLNSYPDDHHRQVDDEYDEPDNDHEDTPHGDLNDEVRKIKRAAFESCINDIEVKDDHTLVKTIWGQIQHYAQNPYLKGVAIITAIFLFRTGLFMAYRAAKKQGLEIVNL
ncbi:MAG TPA: hypothetical protein VFC84_08580 [Desulfosporosinus sp.]|nr:hypothetical protein [Desulfosporosinus sp.]